MNPTVLLVDDSKENLVLLQRMLNGMRDAESVNTVCFTNAAEALVWCRENEPDLCVVDYSMPGMDGIAFIAEARRLSRFKGIPMVMITGESDVELRQRALMSGANDFLVRPVNLEEFRARLFNALSLRLSLVNPLDNFAGKEMGPPPAGPSRAGGEGEPQGGGEHKVERLAHDVELLARQALEREREQIVFKLSQLSASRDQETGNHMHRVAHVSRLLAQEFGCDRQFYDMIYLAAPMHDIGKVGIPDKILLKPGRLTPEEWEIMKTHTTIGHEMLKDSSSPLLKMGADVAHSHHEKYNGQGYPLGLVGENIPIVGRIVAVADELDALLSVRPYKKAWNPKDALEQMRRERGRHFDPGCIDIMLQHIDAIIDIRKKFADDVLEPFVMRPVWCGVA